jgi:hypothetical protein
MSVISNVRVWPLKTPNAKIAANGDFVVGDIIKIRFTLFKGKELFVSLPGKYGDTVDEKTGKKPWYSDVMVFDEDARLELTKLIIQEFNRVTGNNDFSQGDAPGPDTQETPNNDIPF